MARGKPRDWIEVAVGQACSIRNDLRLPISKEERAGMSGRYPYYGPTGELDRLSEYRLEGTFALIGEDGDHFLDVENKPQTLLVSGRFNVNNHAHVIASTDACSAEWFFNYFRHRSLVSSLTRQGAGRYKLNKAALERLPILLPPKAEQDAINSLIREWDRAIDASEELIAAREKRHRWLLQQLIEHKAARAHWETQELSALILERSERSTGHDEHPVLTSSRRGLFLQSEYFSKQVTSQDNTGYKIMRRGDFTFRSMSDDGRFVFNRLEKYDTGIISPAYGVFYAKEVCPEFLTHFLNSSYFAQLLARETQGGTRKALRFSALAGMEVDLPKRTDQEWIASILDESRREIGLLQMQLEMLRRQKRGLMQKLLTGDWRVPVTEAEVA
ncbi:restriction endonuclease subunit S [Thiomonas bhubaneswarensis]|uniref:Restriction endonuclease S subunit n=1 Tax=Thiomonas bhubaneswarensis TaxID=339866 RepID=A0A0K6I7J5_9BURK|nr:restriction endonuclease subunit S [Thiomonas bhubaneswarensis]CUA99292.1 Restriction endonuclease S subunit [Thiomonas bhubaneswarensis]